MDYWYMVLTLNVFFKLQKKLVRLILHKRYNAHTDPLLKSLNSLKIEDIFKLKALQFHFKNKNSMTPEYFNDFFDHQVLQHNYNTRFKDKPIHMLPNKASCENCIRYYIPSLLKDILYEIFAKIDTHSHKGFTNYIKIYDISQYKVKFLDPYCYICSK